MALKRSGLAALLLCLTLLLLFVHGWIRLGPQSGGDATPATAAAVGRKHLRAARLLAVLAKSDHHTTRHPDHDRHRHRHGHHRHRHGHHKRHSPAADPGGEIDPRYGVEKRLVPTGPNPLHH